MNLHMHSGLSTFFLVVISGWKPFKTAGVQLCENKKPFALNLNQILRWRKSGTSNRRKHSYLTIYRGRAVITHRQCPVMTPEQYLRLRESGKRRGPKPSLHAVLWQSAGAEQEWWYKAMQAWGVGGGLFLKKAPEICRRWRFHLQKHVARSYQEKLCRAQKKKRLLYKIAYPVSAAGQEHYGENKEEKHSNRHTPKWTL